MGKIKNYRDLEVWKKGIKLVVDCYKITKSFPADEIYGLGTKSADPPYPFRPILLRGMNVGIEKNFCAIYPLLTDPWQSWRHIWKLPVKSNT